MENELIDAINNQLETRDTCVLHAHEILRHMFKYGSKINAQDFVGVLLKIRNDHKLDFVSTVRPDGNPEFIRFWKVPVIKQLEEQNDVEA